VTFSKKTGDIYDVDMEINAQQPLSTTEIVDRKDTTCSRS